MTRDELANQVADLRAEAEGCIRLYAARSCPAVSRSDLDAICRALGEISTDEALAGLDRIQAAGGDR